MNQSTILSRTILLLCCFGLASAGCMAESVEEEQAATEAVEESEEALGLGNADAACQEICECEDPHSVAACKAVCRSRQGYGSIPACVACVNTTHSCIGVEACLGSPVCSGF